MDVDLFGMWILLFNLSWELSENSKDIPKEKKNKENF